MATTAVSGADVLGRVSRWRTGARVRVRRGFARAGAAARKVSAPVRAPLGNLAQMPLTVAGVGCIDAAAFVGNEIAGLVVTGLSLMGLEFLIADDE